MIRSRVGSPVSGENFFDRENEQRQLWEYLHGDDILLLAPRRVGKTSLMYRLRYLLDVLENDGYLIEDGQRYRFRSPLLREFWLKRVVP